MHVITFTRLRQFWEVYPDAEPALRLWYTRMRGAHFANMAEVKELFPSADKVGRLTVFNIKGNKYRLIVRIEFQRQKIYIRHVLTHREYDRNRWKNDDWY
jgi:mRNA interferase HigB